MARRKSTKKEVIDTKEMEIIEISQPKQIVDDDNLNTEKDELLDVSEEVVNDDVIIGDSAVDNVTVEEIQESNVVKDIKRTQTAYKTKKINPMVFGYVWNGQEFEQFVNVTF